MKFKVGDELVVNNETAVNPEIYRVMLVEKVPPLMYGLLSSNSTITSIFMRDKDWVETNFKLATSVSCPILPQASMYDWLQSEHPEDLPATGCNHDVAIYEDMFKRIKYCKKCNEDLGPDNGF